jgi:hypothetical protein
LRIFLAGASGVIGVRLIPLLVDAEHQVAGMTRTPGKADLIRDLGAEPVVCDVYDRGGLIAAVRASEPDMVMHQLTDLPDHMDQFEAQRDRNNRIRTEGTSNLLYAAKQAGADRFLAQSIAWRPPAGGEAVDEHERLVLDAGGIVLEYGTFYGPGTFGGDKLPPPGSTSTRLLAGPLRSSTPQAACTWSPKTADCKLATTEGVVLGHSKRGAMNEHEASRTLVKSPPELWAECSDADSLARHLSGLFFGEIRITRLEPETTVAWEGERASGTVRLEPSGWGTRVTLTVAPGEHERAPAVPEPAPEPEPEPQPVLQPGPPIAQTVAVGPQPRRRLFERLASFFKPAPEESAVPQAPAPGASALPQADAPAGAPPPAEADPPPETEPQMDPDPGPEAALSAALDSLGQAHHRPFSRA